jgi:hypothetical protein
MIQSTSLDMQVADIGDIEVPGYALRVGPQSTFLYYPREIVYMGDVVNARILWRLAHGYTDAAIPSRTICTLDWSLITRLYQSLPRNHKFGQQLPYIKHPERGPVPVDLLDPGATPSEQYG